MDGIEDDDKPMRDRPAIPHRRIKQSMVVLQWHWLTSPRRRPPGIPLRRRTAVAYGAELYPAVAAIGTWTATHDSHAAELAVQLCAAA